MPPAHEPARFLIYGAYGYTGALIAQAAVEQGMQPVLAGRNAEKLRPLAERLNLESRPFSLEDPDAVQAALSGIRLVLHCAGPFVHTWQPVFEACLRAGVHYLDITGEVGVFEALAACSAQAKQAGITVLPGVGFDVVPSDCLAAHLKKRLPGAARLALALRGLGGISQGTALTGVENLSQSSMIRRGGQLTPVPAGRKTRRVDFGRGPVLATAVAWGDISTAYYSTGIPNIEVYMPMGGAQRALMQWNRLLGSGIASQALKKLLQKIIRAQFAGPTDEQRARGLGLLWGEVVDNLGRRAVSRLTTPEPYTLTALAALEAVRRVLNDAVPTGFQTPSLAFGSNFILEIPGSVREDLL